MDFCILNGQLPRLLAVVIFLGGLHTERSALRTNPTLPIGEPISQTHPNHKSAKLNQLRRMFRRPGAGPCALAHSNTDTK